MFFFKRNIIKHILTPVLDPCSYLSGVCVIDIMNLLSLTEAVNSEDIFFQKKKNKTYLIVDSSTAPATPRQCTEKQQNLFQNAFTYLTNKRNDNQMTKSKSSKEVVNVWWHDRGN